MSLLYLAYILMIQVVYEFVDDVTSLYETYIPQKIWQFKFFSLLCFIYLNKIFKIRFNLLWNPLYVGLYIVFIGLYIPYDYYLKKYLVEQVEVEDWWATENTLYKPISSSLLFLFYYITFNCNNWSILLLGCFLIFYTFLNCFRLYGLKKLKDCIRQNWFFLVFKLIEGSTYYLFIKFPLLSPLYSITIQFSQLICTLIQKKGTNNLTKKIATSIKALRRFTKESTEQTSGKGWTLNDLWKYQFLDLLVYMALYITTLFLGQYRVLGVENTCFGFFGQIVYYWFFNL